MRRSFFLFILLLSVRVFAQDSCSTKNLKRPSLGPVRNQKNSNSCYAFAAADLLSFKVGKTVSAADVKLNYDQWYLKEHPWTSKLWKEEGGDVGQSLEEAFKNGLCLEENFPSNPSSTIFQNGKVIAESKDLNERLKDAEIFIEKMNHRVKDQGWEIIKKRLTGREASCENFIKTPDSLGPNLSVLDHLMIAQSSDHANVLQNYQQKLCKTRQKIPSDLRQTSWSGTAYNYRDSTKAFNALNEQLDQENLVAIKYDIKLLNAESASGVHASTVVGRERDPKTGDCMYWIRNSYGSCHGINYNHKCVDGNILVPGTELKKHLFGYTYLN